jgi:hypothetical protein
MAFNNYRLKPEDKKRCTEKTRSGTRCTRWAVVDINGPRCRLCKTHVRMAEQRGAAERAKGVESYIKWLEK